MLYGQRAVYCQPYHSSPNVRHLVQALYKPRVLFPLRMPMQAQHKPSHTSPGGSAYVALSKPPSKPLY